MPQKHRAWYETVVWWLALALPLHCSRNPEERPGLAAVLEQLQDRVLLSVDSSANTGAWRPLSALEGWRDAAERTLLGKEPASEADGGALGPTGPHVASSRSSDDSRRAVSSGKNPAATCGSASTTGADDAGGRRRAVWPATLAVPQTIAHTVSA